MSRLVVSGLVGLALVAARARAQDMEPKAYSASPVGANFLVTSYSGSSGGVVLDPTLPITNVHANVKGLAIGAGHTFGLFGDLALFSVAVPIVRADVTGQVYEQSGEVIRSGLGDMRLKLSVNLRGNPASTPAEFAKAPRSVIVGTSVAVIGPSGQYDGTKLINLGTNRWAFKPEIGVSVPKGRWDFDGYLGVWLFTDNADFFPGGQLRTQTSQVAIQGHASYTIRRGMWIAADGTWYHGGATSLNSGAQSTPLNNTRLGVTASVPFGGRYSVKVAYGNGVIVRTGTNFSTVAVAWQVLWLSPKWAGR
jgi:hypothetical protein